MENEQKIAKLKELHELGLLSQAEYSKKVKSILYPSEQFQWRKVLKSMFSLLDPVEWSKTFRELGITDVRKWIIVGLVILSIWGWGYVKGKDNAPVNFDMHGKEATIALNEHFLHILKDGSAQVEDKDGVVLKTIRVKDIPELRKKLKPFGFDVNPFFTAGSGVSVKGAEGEIGFGTSIFKFYKVHWDAWLTNLGIYTGADYQLTDNFGVLVGVGKGYEDLDNRIYIGGKWEF